MNMSDQEQERLKLYTKVMLYEQDQVYYHTQGRQSYWEMVVIVYIG